MEEKKALNDREMENVTGGLYVVKVPNPFEILDNCKKCGLCLECPYDCISIGASKYVIDRTVCVGCGYCAGRCPENAIQPCFN